MNLIRILLILCIILLSNLFYDAIHVCPSITIQGSINDNSSLNLIHKCEIILGYVRILNANLYNQTLFTNLVEVTDYILIFNLKQVKTLDQIFPKLSIIRGDQLYKNFSLIILLSTSLERLNLINLVSIERGSVFISRLYQACNLDTISWNYLTKDKNAQSPVITLTNNDCSINNFSPKKCLISYDTKNRSTSYYWNDKSCQIICPFECSNSCNLATEKCCSSEKCLYCDKNELCVACKNYRDLSTGKCVESCMNHTLQYENHSCVNVIDCSSISNYTRLSKYYILNEKFCIKECPKGYRSETIEKLINGKKVKFRECKKCLDGVCKRDCFQSIIIRTHKQLELVKNCVRVHSLQIELLETNITNSILADNFEYLEEITGYLVIQKNRHLTSLGFFKNLKIIKGESLYNDIYAFIAHTNEALKDLFNDKVKSNLKILNGRIRFYENPLLCSTDIKEFVQLQNQEINDEVSNFNGYRSILCSKDKIDLRLNVTATSINVSWSIIFNDLRRLRGYTLGYKMIFNESNIDLDETYSSQSCYAEKYSNSMWKYLFVPFDEFQNVNFTITREIIVEPFKRYAIYVKADVLFDSHWNDKHVSLSRTISDIYYVYSLPAKPSKVEDLKYQSISNDSIQLKWDTPIRPNGIISSYVIALIKLNDSITLPDNPCQSDQKNYFEQSQKLNEDLDLIQSCPNSNVQQENRFDNRNEIISLEDDILNMAFLPNPKYKHNKFTYLKRKKKQLTFDEHKNKFKELFENDLMLEIDTMYLKETNQTHIKLENLIEFTRYLIAVIACQDLNDTNAFDYCSQSSVIIIRTLPNEIINKIDKLNIKEEKLDTIVTWSLPKKLTGFVYKYNIKLIDKQTNEYFTSICVPAKNELQLSLNSLMFSQSKEYFIQIQAISNAGEGVWSEPLEYKINNQSNKYSEILSGILVSSVVMLLTVITILFIIILRQYRKSNSKEYLTTNSQYYILKNNEWEIKKENLVILERINGGCYGEVFKGKLKLKDEDEVDCAVKIQGPNRECRDRILSEASILQSIKASHIVQLIGIISTQDPICIVLEFMYHGDLKEYLQKHRPHQELCDDKLTTRRFYKMAAGIADGMLWLSEHKYIHCDLAARNCLVSKDEVIKIADLGLSKDIYLKSEYRKKNLNGLPIRWMALESLTSGLFTSKSDVWSFGIVLWEMSTYGDQPYSDLNNDQVIKYVKCGGRLKLPPNSPAKFIAIFDRCMIRDPIDRVEFRQILEILEPDLCYNFKSISYYNNEFKSQIANQNTSNSNNYLDINLIIPLVDDEKN